LINALTRAAAAAAIWIAGTSLAAAEPITLKLAYFSSDRTGIYQSAIRPFVEAVNAEGAGLVNIEVAFSGALGKDVTKQVEIVRDGKADIVFVVPGYRPDLFPDDAVVELPGLFRDAMEGSLVYTALTAARLLAGYDDLVVLGAFAGDPEMVHMRAPITTLDDLAGRRIRVNNPIEGATLKALGAIPVELPINRIAMALGSGELDGAMLPMNAIIFEFGVARMAAHHYLLKISAVPLTMVMRRDTFDALPEAVRAILTKYSGTWAAKKFATMQAASQEETLAKLRGDPKRTVVEPSAADQERADAIFAQVIYAWATANSHNRDLLAKAKDTIAEVEGLNQN
jgi:TRAP-type C4-dicarboxylate transport system substrate-binding protein